MKIGINNIFTTFWFFLMFLCGGTLTYFAFDKKIFTGDLIFVGKFFVGLIVLVTIGLIIYVIFKFRIIIVANNKIVSYYPFLFKKKKVDLKTIKKLKLENFFAFKGTVYKKIKITDSNGTLEITDLEFENFERLTSEIKVDVNKKKIIDFKQANSNFSSTNFNVYLLLGILIFLIYNAIWVSGYHIIIFAFGICVGILLYVSIKRKIKYKRIIKNSLQQRL